MKKVYSLLLAMMLSTVVYSITIPKTCTKIERIAIKKIVKEQKQDPIEISKGLNTNGKVVIEFTNIIYVLIEDLIDKIYVLGNEDWMELRSLDEVLPNSAQRLTALVYNINEGYSEQRIEIQPINGTPEWTLYYSYSFYDARICATIYVGERASIAIGEDFVFYEDGLDTWYFNINPCEEIDISE